MGTTIVGILCFAAALPGAIHDSWLLYEKWKSCRRGVNSMKPPFIVATLKIIAWIVMMAVGGSLLIKGHNEKQNQTVIRATPNNPASQVNTLTSAVQAKPEPLLRKKQVARAKSNSKTVSAAPPITPPIASNTITQNGASSAICNGSGPCAGTNNGNQTVNYGAESPPPAVVSLVVQDANPRPASDPLGQGPYGRNPGSTATSTLSGFFTNARFMVHCNRPCVLENGTIHDPVSSVMSQWKDYFDPNNPQRQLVYFAMPSTIEPGQEVSISVRSVDGQPVAITHIEVLSCPLKGKL